MNDPKIYVEVIAAFDSDGSLLPLTIVWEDGRKFEIDKVLEVRQAAAMKAGGQGDRYTIQVRGKNRYLYFERNPRISGSQLGRWFVETR